MPAELQKTIAANIRACRLEKFPGRGGAKKCAEAFGVSPQQWSPWERGMRTPDETRLQRIADFFGVTVEYLRRDNTVRPNRPEPPPPPMPERNPGQCRDCPNAGPNPYAWRLPGMSSLDPPGSPASFYLLARHVVDRLVAEGVKVRLDEDSVDRIVRKCRECP